jgi:hypothetical protein
MRPPLSRLVHFWTHLRFLKSDVRSASPVVVKRTRTVSYRKRILLTFDLPSLLKNKLIEEHRREVPDYYYSDASLFIRCSGTFDAPIGLAMQVSLCPSTPSECLKPKRGTCSVYISNF